MLQWLDLQGRPINLQGWTPKAQTRDGRDLGATITDMANGITVMALPKQITAGYGLGVVQWDWIWIQNSPFVITWPPFLSGLVSIQEPNTEL